MDTTEAAAAAVSDVIIKKEPPESMSPLQDDDNSSNNNNNSNNNNPGNDNDNAGGGGIGDGRAGSGPDSGASDTDSKPSPHGSLRYVSRRGRPPGGGYSIKSSAHYLAFGAPSSSSSSSAAVSASSMLPSQDFGRRSALSQSSSSSISPHDFMKSGLTLTSGLDALDARRFGCHAFDSEKNSFRCEGCDVVFSSRDTYAMHMLMRAKNESCVALPTSAISSNPENPTPREKFEREIREKAMLAALRNQAALMSKAAAATVPKSVESLSSSLRRGPSATKDDLSMFGASDVTSGLSSLLAFDTYGLYVDHRQYRRLLSEYGLRSPSSGASLSAMMEQLSCSVCGEMFTNKDALAMHMMFHTRDVDTDNKVSMSWRGDSVVHANHSFSFSDLEAEGHSTDSTNASRRQDNAKSPGDRQLTAERIAELKRMAIESSLRSSLKKHSMNQDKHSAQSTRPKSVSEEMVVTSSAQTRPLSADDAIKISNFSDKSIYKPHKTTTRWDFNSSNNSQEFSQVPTRKRNLSVSEERCRDNDSFFPSSYAMNKQFRYDSTSLSALAKNSQYLKSVLSLTTSRDKNSKVCDNHVSSASGPQDSDETSDGSSSVAEQIQEEANSNRKLESGQGTPPSLDTIMSGDTILVPVENLEDVQDGEKNDRGRISSANAGFNGSEITAIDFSVGRRDQANDDDDDDDPAAHETPGSVVPRKDYSQGRYHSAAAPFRYRSSDADDDPNRQLYLPQHHVELVHNASGVPLDSARPVPTSSHSSLRGGGEVNGSSSDAMSETSSRVGEARYCPHCEILFLDVTLFHLHMGLHNVNNPWQCNTCGLVCGGRLEFNTHVLHY